MRSRFRFIAPALLGCTLALPSLAQKAVDQSDSMDFESFHDEPQESQGGGLRGLFGGEKKYDRGVNVFSDELDNPTGKGSVIVETLGGSNTLSATKSSPFLASTGTPPASGPVMNIRVRYALAGSDRTPFLANTAVVALHSYIVEHCPGGWIKLAEWTLPIEKDFYLYHQFQCIGE